MRHPLALLPLLATLALLLPAHAATPDFIHEETWFGVYMSGQKAGWGRMGSRESAWQGAPAIETYSEMTLVMRALGLETKLSITQAEYADPATGDLIGMTFQQETGMALGGQSLRIDRDGEELVVETLSGERVTGTRRIPVPAGVTTSVAAADLAEKLIDPATGGEVTVTIFDPTALRPVTVVAKYLPLASIYYNGVAVEAYEVHSEFKELKMSQVSFETADGQLVKSTMMGGLLELRMEEESLAQSDIGMPDLLNQSKVTASGMPIPTQPVAHLELTPALTGEGATALKDLFFSTAAQRIETRDGAERLVIDMLGPGQGPSVTLSAEEMRRYLGGDLYVQPEDPTIQGKSREILDGVGSGESARAFAIVEWVYRNVKKQIVPTTPNAVQVLETMRGDCGEHAVLTAALLRAAGLPTKIHYGLVYTPMYGEGFFYHAWNVVLIDGRWTEVDAALGMFPADATHIAFGEGDDPGDALGIMQLYGRLSFEVHRAVEGEFAPAFEMREFGVVGR